MKLNELGRLGKLEAARQALQEAGSAGLLGREVMQAAGIYNPNASGGNFQHFLCQLTAYCAIYEDDRGKRYYLNEEMDENFNRRIFAEDTFADDKPRGAFEDQEDIEYE